MTPEQLASIRARLAAATPGPWAVEDITSDHLHDICLAYTIPGAGNPILLASVYGDDDSSDPIGLPAANANAALIVNAPADIATLLAYVEQLEGLLRDLCEDSRAAAEVVRLWKVVDHALRYTRIHAKHSAQCSVLVRDIETLLDQEGTR